MQKVLDTYTRFFQATGGVVQSQKINFFSGNRQGGIVNCWFKMLIVGWKLMEGKLIK